MSTSLANTHTHTQNPNIFGSCALRVVVLFLLPGKIRMIWSIFQNCFTDSRMSNKFFGEYLSEFITATCAHIRIISNLLRWNQQTQREPSNQTKREKKTWTSRHFWVLLFFFSIYSLLVCFFEAIETTDARYHSHNTHNNRTTKQTSVLQKKRETNVTTVTVCSVGARNERATETKRMRPNFIEMKNIAFNRFISISISFQTNSTLMTWYWRWQQKWAATIREKKNAMTHTEGESGKWLTYTGTHSHSDTITIINSFIWMSEW